MTECATSRGLPAVLLCTWEHGCRYLHHCSSWRPSACVGLGITAWDAAGTQNSAGKQQQLTERELLQQARGIAVGGMIVSF